MLSLFLSLSLLISKILLYSQNETKTLNRMIYKMNIKECNKLYE